MTILVDCDDVLEQLVAAWVEYNNLHFGTDVSVDDVTDWDLSIAFPTLTEEQLFQAERDDALWYNVQPMPGASEALQKLIAEGHEIFLVTATRYETVKSKMENVVFKYFPFIDWDHVIITTRKQMIKGDVLIDDGPHNMQGGEYEKILFDARHNRNFDESSVGAVRVHNWEEAYEQVLRIAEELNK